MTIAVERQHRVDDVLERGAGRRSVPSLVTWPTNKVATPQDLAYRTRRAAHSRTWLGDPAWDPHPESDTAWMESTTRTDGSRFPAAFMTQSRSVVAEHVATLDRGTKPFGAASHLLGGFLRRDRVGTSSPGPRCSRGPAGRAWTCRHRAHHRPPSQSRKPDRRRVPGRARRSRSPRRRRRPLGSNPRPVRSRSSPTRRRPAGPPPRAGEAAGGERRHQLLDEGVPLTTGRTAPGPARRTMPACLAEVNRLRSRHVSKLRAGCHIPFRHCLPAELLRSRRRLLRTHGRRFEALDGAEHESAVLLVYDHGLTHTELLPEDLSESGSSTSCWIARRRGLAPSSGA